MSFNLGRVVEGGEDNSAQGNALLQQLEKCQRLAY